MARFSRINGTFGQVALAVLLLAATLVSLRSARGTLLLPAEMRNARGGVQYVNTGTFNCDDLSGFNPCIYETIGLGCNYCVDPTYTDVGSVVGSGWDSGQRNGGSCGNIVNGTCEGDIYYQDCFKDNDTINPCDSPPAPPKKEGGGG
jgi:hypothetical protein